MRAYLKLQDQLDQLKSNKDKLQYLVDAQPSNYKMYLENEKFGFRYLYEWIIEQTPLLDDPVYELKTKIYWVLNDIHDFPLCEVDHKPLKNINVYSPQQGYKQYTCSKQCANKLAYNKYVQTMIANYGVSNNYQRKDVKQKIADNNLKKYGTACPANNKEIRKKIEADNIKKYGVKSYSSTDECKNKVKTTVMARYGVTSVSQLESSKSKAKKTSLEKYGTEYPCQSDKIKQKNKQSLIDKYGENYSQILWGNRGNSGQSKRAYNEYILHNDFVEPCFSEDDYINSRLNGKNEFLFRCKKCKKTFLSYWDNGGTKSCPFCKITQTKTSKAEYELYSYIIELSENKYSVKHNARGIIDDYELDVYIPSRNLAFEFDGLYWHNDDVNHNYKYHLMKTDSCEKADIHLIHIFENEWRHQSNIVKSRINALVGKYDKTIFARNCCVREINIDCASDFLERTHIQGAVNAKVNLGLFNDGKLIALMTFGKSRFNKKYEWELLRFCTELGYHIPGGASKLLKYFERNHHPKSLISYADRRWSQGKLYTALGFNLDHISAPNYWYFKSYACTHLESRVKYQKHRLKTLLPMFNENLSEVENMKNNGYHRIFDCGNLVFTKVYNNII